MLVTRRIDIFDPTVITITKLISGTAYNVIPEVARVEGTIRALSDKTRRNVHDGIRRVAEGIAAAHEMSAEVIIELGYPVTVNDSPSADFALDVATSIVGDEKTARMPTPIMGAEDFSYVLEKLPGAMVFLGGTPTGMDPSKAPPNHSNRVKFDEDAMTTGIALYSAMALRTLGVMLD
jgi:hippurate hydrolase